MNTLLRKMLLGTIAIAGLMSLSNVSAAELPASSRAEVEALLNRLAASGCQFSRNGSWYSAQEAKSHLTKKLDYVLEKKMVSSSEQFIELAASKSSMSGKPYQVKCGNQAAQDSATWLQGALKDLRANKTGADKK